MGPIQQRYPLRADLRQFKLKSRRAQDNNWCLKQHDPINYPKISRNKRTNCEGKIKKWKL